MEINQKMANAKLCSGDSEENLDIKIKLESGEKFDDVHLEAGEKIQFEVEKKIKFEPDNTEEDFGEMSAVDSTEKMKRGSLSKLFRFNGLRSKSSKTNLNSTSACFDEDTKAKSSSKVGALSRMFSKKTDESGVDDEPKKARSFSLRGIVNCQAVPWIRSKTSQMNLHKPIDVPLHDDEEATQNEVVKETIII